jgi:hypothetical protein
MIRLPAMRIAARIVEPGLCKTLIISGSSLVVLVLSAFLARGWIRTTALPNLTGVFILHRLTSVEQAESGQIMSLLPPFADTTSNYHGCGLAESARFNTDIDCFASTTTTENRTGVGLPVLLNGQSELEHHGWTPDGGSTALTPSFTLRTGDEAVFSWRFQLIIATRAASSISL